MASSAYHAARDRFCQLVRSFDEARLHGQESAKQSLADSLDAMAKEWNEQGLIETVLSPLLASGKAPIVRVSAADYLLRREKCVEAAKRVLRDFAGSDHLGNANLDAQRILKELEREISTEEPVEE